MRCNQETEGTYSFLLDSKTAAHFDTSATSINASNPNMITMRVLRIIGSLASLTEFNHSSGVGPPGQSYGPPGRSYGHPDPPGGNEPCTADGSILALRDRTIRSETNRRLRRCQDVSLCVSSFTGGDACRPHGREHCSRDGNLASLGDQTAHPGTNRKLKGGDVVFKSKHTGDSLQSQEGSVFSTGEEEVVGLDLPLAACSFALMRSRSRLEEDGDDPDELPPGDR